MPWGRSAGTARVFLHVGSPKTGTTFLQNVLWSQRDLAREQGLLLPGERFNDHYLATLDVRGLAGKPPHPQQAVGMWDRLAKEAARWQGPALISHELFAGASHEQARRAVETLADQAELHVVVTARDLVRQMTAEWQEHVKHRSTQTFEDFVTSLRTDDEHKTWFWRVQDFADVVERWAAGLPPSQVHVVTVPPAGAPATLLWERFATLLGLDPHTFDLGSSRPNTSLGIEQTEVLRRVNLALGDRLPVPGPYPAVVKDVLAHRILAGREGSPIRLAPSDVEFAAARSGDIAARLAESGVDVVGDLADLTAAAQATEASGDAYATPPAEALVNESVAALAELLVDLADRRAGQRQLRERLAQAEQAPIRFALVAASERRPTLRRARRLYRRVVRRPL